MFKGIQRTFTCTQINNGSIDDVFPLLCPVREKDWIDGWDYKMIHSKSGLIEKDCVFTTPHHGKFDTVWQVTRYDPVNFSIEFLRVTPLESIVRINIDLEEIEAKNTKVIISYRYTALCEDQNMIIENEMEQKFRESMEKWERSINHFLLTGRKLTG